MINIQPTGIQPASDNQSRPLRRPGWNLIHDIRPTRQTPVRTAAVQLESRKRPATPATSHNQPAPPLLAASRKRRLARWLHRYSLVLTAPLIVIISVRLSVLPLVGESLIAIYGLIAIIRRIPSRFSFWLATVVLSGIGIEFVALPGAGRANNGALFVFLLLGIGLLSSMLETRRMVTLNKASRRR